MSENKDTPILYYNKLVEYIKEKTDYEKSVIYNVLEFEERYMRNLGITVYDLDERY